MFWKITGSLFLPGGLSDETGLASIKYYLIWGILLWRVGGQVGLHEPQDPFQHDSLTQSQARRMQQTNQAIYRNKLLFYDVCDLEKYSPVQSVHILKGNGVKRGAGFTLAKRHSRNHQKHLLWVHHAAIGSSSPIILLLYFIWRCCQGLDLRSPERYQAPSSSPVKRHVSNQGCNYLCQGYN